MKVYIFSVIILLLFVFIILYCSVEKYTKRKEKVSAILFVHGFNGNLGTFDKMISEIFPVKVKKNIFCYNKLNYNPESIDKVAKGTGVAAERAKIIGFSCNSKQLNRSVYDKKIVDKLEIFSPKENVLTKYNNVNYYLAQVLYDDTDTKKQTKYIEYTLDEIAKDYDIQNIILVAHSMGGLGCWRFTIDSKKYKNKIAGVVALASPFTGLYDHIQQLNVIWSLSPSQIKLSPDDLTSFTLNYVTKYQNTRPDVPPNFSMLNIVGNSDWVVIKSGATKVSQMLKKYNINASAITEDTDHMDITDEDSVIKRVRKFITDRNIIYSSRDDVKTFA